MNRLESLSKMRGLEGAYMSLLSRSGPSHKGHKHFWQRALSRRGFLGTAAGVAGGASVIFAHPLGAELLGR
jgi:hypothetical protein